MPKFVSRCGYVIDLSGIPGEHEHKLISEVEVENLTGLLEDNRLTSEDLFKFLDSKATTVYKCPNCGRLYLEKRPNVFSPFKHEDISISLAPANG